MARQLTIRGVPDEVIIRIEAVSRLRGQSINTTVNQILEEAMAASARRRRLERFVTWTADDEAELKGALESQRQIDGDLWR